jgi:hypothetical protein
MSAVWVTGAVAVAVTVTEAVTVTVAAAVGPRASFGRGVDRRSPLHEMCRATATVTHTGSPCYEIQGVSTR